MTIEYDGNEYDDHEHDDSDEYRMACSALLRSKDTPPPIPTHTSYSVQCLCISAARSVDRGPVYCNVM
jgi:hypothetical protein